MRPGETAALVLAVVIGAAGAARAAACDAPLPCARLLTAAEVSAAAGAGFENVGEDEPETGKSECIWLLDRAPNPKAVVVTFWQKKAVPGGDLAAFFETQAKRAEAVHENKREKLPGIGAAAALVPGMKPGAMAVLIVQTAEGVAYVETDYLVRSQVTDIAKAVAAP